jgi:curli biogenesis system outer membrane secretion channel CsgG
MSKSRYKNLLMLAAVVFLCCAPGFAQERRKRVAVLDFDYSSIQPWWGESNWNIGLGISELIVDQLLKDGTFSLVERKTISAVMAEQNFSHSERSDPSSAARVGKLLSADVILVGTVSQFGIENKNTGIVGRVGPYWPWWSKGGGGEIGKTKGKAKVAITARMVDVNTGEILASVNGVGTSQRSGLLLGGAGGSWRKGGGGGLSMTSSDFQETILGEATLAAVKDGVKGLVAEKDKVPATRVELRGMIADVSGQSVVINIGKSHGVQVGQTLKVQRVQRAVKDPATGKVLREVADDFGPIRITEADYI